MGTRHLIIVYYRGQYHIAQYGQWDGYPGGQGLTVLHFLGDATKVSKLRSVLDRANTMLYEPTDAQLDELFAEINRANKAKYSLTADPREEIELSTAAKCVTRDTGADILEVVANATEPVPIVKSLEFLSDRVFCEWAYVVDLDEDVLEVYGKGVEVRSGWVRFEGVEGLRNAKSLPPVVGAWRFEELPNERSFLKSLDSEPGEE
ncbi:hypothetical protein C8Q80DRAFT_842058 [Daedaleopsis nitida]|nr:hypothetical protein C8Q80DRAFT_842058 [Daedaleopsis nitida]